MHETLTVTWILVPLGWEHDLPGNLLIGDGAVPGLRANHGRAAR